MHARPQAEPEAGEPSAESEPAFALERMRLQFERLQLQLARLSQFVPASVARIVDGEPPGGRAQVGCHDDVTVLFLDVEDYEALSRIVSDHALGEIIERYFSRFVDVLHEHGGEINETAGDGLMVLFQSTDPRAHARCAAQAALRIKRAVGETAALPGVPKIRVNIGVNSGHAWIGERRFAGSVATRSTYTATGATTIRAARLQQAARDGIVLVGETTEARIRGEFLMRDLGRVPAHRKGPAVRAYELLGERSDWAVEALDTWGLRLARG